MIDRLRLAVAYVAALEPARVIAAWKYLVILLGLAGVVVTTPVNEGVVAGIAAVIGLAELIATKITRARVVPVSKLPTELVERVELGPLPGSRAAELSAGG